MPDERPLSFEERFALLEERVTRLEESRRQYEEEIRNSDEKKKQLEAEALTQQRENVLMKLDVLEFLQKQEQSIYKLKKYL